MHSARWLKTLKVRAFASTSSFLGYLIENASRYKVEKLLEDDNVRVALVFSAYPQLSGKDPFSSPLFLANFVIPVGWLCPVFVSAQ